MNVLRNTQLALDQDEERDQSGEKAGGQNEFQQWQMESYFCHTNEEKRKIFQVLNAVAEDVKVEGLLLAYLSFPLSFVFWLGHGFKLVFDQLIDLSATKCSGDVEAGLF